jgi:hypothetical protein
MLFLKFSINKSSKIECGVKQNLPYITIYLIPSYSTTGFVSLKPCFMHFTTSYKTELYADLSEQKKTCFAGLMQHRE